MTGVTDTPAAEPTPLQLGDVVRDNDPRSNNREMFVFKWAPGGKAVLRLRQTRLGAAGETRVSISRIHLDGKARKSGWSRVDGVSDAT